MLLQRDAGGKWVVRYKKYAVYTGKMDVGEAIEFWFKAFYKTSFSSATV